MTNETNNSADSLASAGGVEVVAWMRKSVPHPSLKDIPLSRLLEDDHALVLESAHLAALSKEREVADGWISVAEQMPPSGLKVLATYVNRAGKRRTICAEWVAAKTVESSDSSDIGEYDEEADMYFDPEGWYEQMDNWEEYTALAVTEGEITHWQRLPPHPIDAALTAHRESRGGK